MLQQRKRFNYMVNSGHTTSAHKQTYTSAVKPTFVSSFREQSSHSRVEDKQNIKKVEELEVINKRLVEQTAKQFKKLEEDVHRVQNILQEKEQNLDTVKTENAKLKEQVNKVSEQKKILIQAIFQKDLVIKEYEMKVKELIEERVGIEAKTPQKPLSIMNEAAFTQTQPLPESCPKKEFTDIQKQNFELEDEVYRLKQELFDATNKVKLITQQFEAFKILKQIEAVQQN